MSPHKSRHETPTVLIGDVPVGASHPVMIQSMTDTDTADVGATVAQVHQLWLAGSEVVRITVNTPEAAAAVPEIAEHLANLECRVPLVGDFHYNGHRLLADFPECASALAKYRINPGNVGFGRKRDAQFAAIIEQAMRHGKPVRIGVNWGSLDESLLARLMDENAARARPASAAAVMREALIRSALDSAAFAEREGMRHDRILLSCKVSDVQELIHVYRSLASRCDYPLHLGLTEAGMGIRGTVASSAALAILLGEGIGDTIRVSLTPAPGQPRTDEVRIARDLLQSMGFRAFVPQVSACPGCGRTTSTFFRELAARVQADLEARMPGWRETHPGAEGMKLAVMGCVVNGPGESRHADIGISLPGTGEDPSVPVFVDGEKVTTLKGDDIAGEFMRLVENYVDRRYGRNS